MSTIRYCDPEFEIICKNKDCKETHYYKDLRIANTKCNKYQTKFINLKIDKLWEMTRKINDSKLAIDFMFELGEIRKSINDKVITHS